MNYTVVKQMKSRGIAFLLVLFFGPFGIFYSSIVGGIVMIIVAPIAALITLFIAGITGSAFLLSLVLIFCCLYYVICFIWAIRAVESYNNKILSDASAFNKKNVSAGYNTPSNSPVDNILNQKISDLHLDLDKLETLRTTNVVSEESYNKQKERILNAIEVKKSNNTVQNSPLASDNTQANKIKNASNSLWILILFFILILGLLFYKMYDGNTNSFKLDKITGIFSTHSKEKEEIKNQLEKAYFNMLNGGYTSQSISGLGPDGIPFYNTNLNGLMMMGLSPYANFFGGLKVAPSNIEVYDFDESNNSAKVRYDLTVITAKDTVKGRMDGLGVKKIGGAWKFDGEKFFGNGKNKNFLIDALDGSGSQKNKSSEINSTQNNRQFTPAPLFEINDKIYNDISSENTNYEAIKDIDAINHLLTDRLKNQLTKNSKSLTGDYKFFDLGTVKFKDYNLQFFIYDYIGGLGDGLSAQLNVCDQSGKILDTKEIGREYVNPEVENEYTLTTCTIDENGRIVMKGEEQKLNRKKIEYNTEFYFISDLGKIIKQ